ncbi:MAG: ATP-dependent helicase [Tissierellaceae bacterium]
MDLSKEQQVALQHLDGPALILAVPGAGKTTVLIHRTVNLIRNHNVSPERILSITFSRASARDMMERFNRYFPGISSIPIKFSTIHSFCYNLIREYAYVNKINYTIIEDEKIQLNKYNLLKKIYLNIHGEYITEEKQESLLNAIGYIKNMMLTLDEYLAHNKIDIDGFGDIFTEYESYKRDKKLIDFDDMLTLSYKILMENKYLLEKYRARFDYIQVDEGQDTSKIQMEIIKLLASPRNNLFIVADDDQSIYGFRGAYPKGLLGFTRTFPKGKVFYMEKNYRSSKNIVSVCNKFISQNTLRYDKQIVAERDYLEPINIIKVDSLWKQYDYLIEELRDKDLSKSCILYRNNLSSIGLIEALERQKIAFYMRDVKVRFFNHWLIRDIINFMRFSQDSSNMEIFESIYYKMKGYISKKQINYGKTLAYNLSVFDRILDFPQISSYYRKNLRELKLDFKKLSGLKPSRAIEFIEYNLEYERYLKENSTKFGYTYDSLKTMIYYLKHIAENTRDLDELIARLNYLKSLSSNSKNRDNAITLSTVHSAKGLEFDNVYMIDLVDGDFPSISSIEGVELGKFESFEEERRLFYVGMTRARFHLSLISVSSIGRKELEPSRFLIELQN